MKFTWYFECWVCFSSRVETNPKSLTCFSVSFSHFDRALYFSSNSCKNKFMCRVVGTSQYNDTPKDTAYYYIIIYEALDVKYCHIRSATNRESCVLEYYRVDLKIYDCILGQEGHCRLQRWNAPHNMLGVGGSVHVLPEYSITIIPSTVPEHFVDWF